MRTLNFTPTETGIHHRTPCRGVKLFDSCFRRATPAAVLKKDSRGASMRSERRLFPSAQLVIKVVLGPGDGVAMVRSSRIQYAS